ncbi:uncharacterized protein VTP21DRAFT_1501 [Calcarisporiella thermophila]|uniref:uncharacterized protein n=1 Tax=Calcarisporiella thermophila TaxID=911321 RepID=UPI003743A3C6
MTYGPTLYTFIAENYFLRFQCSSTYHPKESPKAQWKIIEESGQLVGCEVNIGDIYAKVITAKMTENSVMVEVKEEVEEGVWDQYEIEYNTNMKPLH